ncbi:hypothetical protein [Mobiluncus curtisii]|uniref:hypothetical protein n=1 Tax=Mobiluncus curtisii TaxID=2051 RepID=UPI0014703C52|nr:hypothetical protein [Mobiluncus curtisii]NMW43177.1 hypothetical protein [Mobiluncus curtisii]NMW83795.1 hypothetical protein [Mobiluncus curtisii]NMW99764.1 hypothetical protein [Mobiluncus curtisii]NMX04708.1 hypothetical protein [Mobiluncus curtisii]
MKNTLIFTGIALIFAILACVMNAPAWMIWTAGGITTAAVIVSVVAFVLERRGGQA